MNNVSLPLSHEEPLARHRDQAEAKLNAAREEYYRTRLIDVARIVRAALPAADSIDLTRNLFGEVGLLLAARTADGTTLWGDELEVDPLAEFRFANGANWRQATEVIEETISQALTGEDPDAAADSRHDWTRLSSIPVEMYRVALPDRATVDHHTSTPPDDHQPRLEVVVDCDSDNGTDAHAFIDGVAVFPEVTVVDPGRGWLLSDWREQAAEEAAAASPAAAEKITDLFGAAESSSFVRDDPA